MGLDEGRGAGIGFNSLLVDSDSDSDGTPDGQELILIVLTWVTQAAPGLAPVGVAVLIGLLAGLGLCGGGLFEFFRGLDLDLLAGLLGRLLAAPRSGSARCRSNR